MFKKKRKKRLEFLFFILYCCVLFGIYDQCVSFTHYPLVNSGTKIILIQKKYDSLFPGFIQGLC